MCKNSGACGGYFTAPNGLLTSPSYPDEYPGKSDCIYTISQPTGTFLNLQIRMFDLYAFDCGNAFDDDYLEIRDGSSELSSLMGKFCGSIFPASLQTTQNQVWMK